MKLVTPIAVCDALGLGLFAVVGARKALDAGLSPLMAALLGMLTAIGGGMVRDIVTARTPMVLRREIYALAALAGAAVLAFGDFAGAPDIVHRAHRRRADDRPAADRPASELEPAAGPVAVAQAAVSAALMPSIGATV